MWSEGRARGQARSGQKAGRGERHRETEGGKDERKGSAAGAVPHSLH